MNILKYFLLVLLVIACSCSSDNSIGIPEPEGNTPVVPEPETDPVDPVDPLDPVDPNPQVETIPAETTFFNGSVATDNCVLITVPVTHTKIQDAIDDLTIRPNGGILKVPSGNHMLTKGVKVKSNVYIEIDKDAILTMEDSFRGAIFSIGTDNATNPITNFKIYSSDATKRYTIDYANNTSNAAVYFASVGYVDGFEISDAEIIDDETLFAGLRIGPDGTRGDFPSFNRISKNGIIKNCNIQNADYGYGLVQIAGGKNIFFKDISGQGGITLRLEGSAKGLKEAGLKVGIQEEIYGQNISCSDGNAAVMLSPHSKEQGKIVVLDVTALNCGVGIRIEKGFGDVNGYYGVKPYVGGKIKIESSGSDFVAQIKEKHYKYYTKSFKDANPYSSLTPLKNNNGDARYGLPIVPIFHGGRLSDADPGTNTDGFYEFTYDPSEEDITGFATCTPIITNREHTNLDCD